MTYCRQAEVVFRQCRISVVWKKAEVLGIGTDSIGQRIRHRSGWNPHGKCPGWLIVDQAIELGAARGGQRNSVPGELQLP